MVKKFFDKHGGGEHKDILLEDSSRNTMENAQKIAILI